MTRAFAWLLFSPALLGLGSCNVNPVSGRQQFNLISEQQEVATGRQGDAEVRKQYGVYADANLQARIETIGRDLAQQSHRPSLPYRFTVLDSATVNAFALPGGPVYITRGLLAYLNTEAEVAAVLGHEVGHVTAQHGAQQYSANQATQLGMALLSVLSPDIGRATQSLVSPLATAWLRGYGRDDELEADRLGAEYLARTGRSPQAMVDVIGVLKNQELFEAERARREGREPRAYHGVFATHPDNDTRLREVIDEARQLTRDDRIKPAPPGAFLATLDGMVLGDSPDQGMVRNGVFRHGPLDFGMNLPSGWRVQNSMQSLIVQAPRNEAQLRLVGLGDARGDIAARLRQALGRTPHTTIARGNRSGIKFANTRGNANGAPFQAIGFRSGGQDLLLTALARDRNAESSMQAAFRAAADSLHPLDAAERESLKPLRICLQKIDRRITYRELTKDSPLGTEAESTLRLINGYWPASKPEHSRTVKVIR
jgi:predicted Zn-dependent protease